MSAPSPAYKSPNSASSNEGTAINVPGQSNGKGHAASEEEDRFVTDDAPLRAAPSRASAGGQGLITVQPLRRSEMQPSYAQDMGANSVEHGFYGTFISGLGACIGAIGAIPCCPCPNPFNRVEQGNVGLVSRLGSFYKAVDPGLVNVNVCSESLRTVDVRIQITAVSSQICVTRDNVNIEVDSVLCWHVVNPYRAAFGIADVRQALVERAQTTLRQVVGARVLQNVLTDREGLAAEIQEIVEGPAEKWGVNIESILLKDLRFSEELQQSLSSAATQKRIGESKVIAARAEVDAAKLMRQAADILSSAPAMQIRQLDALQNMAKQSGSKVIFVPMNLSGMGASSMTGNDQFSQQMHAAAMHEHGQAQPNAGEASGNATLISAMANV